MTQTNLIDFRSLGLMDALDLASLIEDQAKDRYTDLAEQMELDHNLEAASFFRFMRDMESRHQHDLSDTRARRFGSAPRRITRDMLVDVEGPDQDSAWFGMSARAAMEVARASEQKACEFFSDALRLVIDEDVRELFEELREEEYQHQQLLEAELENQPFDPAFGFEAVDFADGVLTL